MNTQYVHVEKEGNLGDVWKRYCLAEIIDQLLKRMPEHRQFHYLEPHAGSGLYKLVEGELDAIRRSAANAPTRKFALHPDATYVDGLPDGDGVARRRLNRVRRDDGDGPEVCQRPVHRHQPWSEDAVVVTEQNMHVARGPKDCRR